MRQEVSNNPINWCGKIMDVFSNRSFFSSEQGIEYENRITGYNIEVMVTISGLNYSNYAHIVFITNDTTKAISAKKGEYFMAINKGNVFYNSYPNSNSLIFEID